MKLTIPATATVESGAYPGRLDAIEQKETALDGGRTYLRWRFTLALPDGSESKVSGITSTNSGPKSRAFGWITALLGRTPRPGEVIDTETLIGRAATVEVGPDGNGYSTVLELRIATASDLPY